jgi:hypothetical protein
VYVCVRVCVHVWACTQKKWARDRTKVMPASTLIASLAACMFLFLSAVVSSWHKAILTCVGRRAWECCALVSRTRVLRNTHSLYVLPFQALQAKVNPLMNSCFWASAEGLKTCSSLKALQVISVRIYSITLHTIIHQDSCIYCLFKFFRVPVLI